MRTISFAAWTILACTTAFADSRAETTTYVDGNLAGISANTGGTLVFSDDKSMTFRTGLTTVSIPYESITRSELGATRVNKHDVAFYKVWARRKKTETQFLTVEFKNEEGEAKSMTLELAQASAPEVLAAIHEHTGKPGASEVASAAAPEAKTEAKAVSKPAPNLDNLEHIKVKAAPAVAKVDAGAKASPATKSGSDWWGDDIWKTTRNAATWNKPAGTSAPEE
jgi:hypothetical protein